MAATTTIRSVPADEDELASTTTRHLLGRIDQAIATLDVARRQLIGATCPPIEWHDGDPPPGSCGAADGWWWACHLCTVGANVSGSLAPVASFRRGHMRAVHAVEVDR